MSTLAIDQGTTSTRALVLDNSGRTTVTYVTEHQQIYPQTNWVEHDPDEIMNNIFQCIKQSLLKYPDIKRMGIDNQGESCLAWDANTKEALSPIIVWQDSRTEDVIQALKDHDIESHVQAISGLPLDPYFSASKLSWLVKHIPKVAAAREQGTLRLGTTDAFFIDRLTGNFVTDITTASRTSLMNLKTGEWDKELCNLFDVPIECLPRIVATTGDFGTVVIDGRSIKLQASICDQQASLFGHGCRKEGDIKITFGTGAFAFAITGNQPIFSPDTGLLPTPAWQIEKEQRLYALDGGVYNAGAAINWAKSLGLFESFDQINQFSKKSAIEEKLLFVPALSGLACPHWDRKAAGLWVGLSLDTSPLDMMQAVLEGIAFRATEVIHAIQQEVSIGNTISIDGGLSANPYFCQFLANILNKDIIVQQFPEITALGTAQLTAGSIAHTENNQSQSNRYQPDKDMLGYFNQFKKGITFSKGWFD